ncbi:hypothetical protein WA026_009423 [Henosepilachna vigintioctopunctata]|uniref:BHLH domain-containing protein n=1 Tax=Henosepilachna vigintioctopunctata TaxID=420089 RepID=A0AAW1U8I7_9CUCU
MTISSVASAVQVSASGKRVRSSSVTKLVSALAMIEYQDLSARLGLSPDFISDSNNNRNSSEEKRGDKYSLRPRTCRKRTLIDDSDEIVTIPTKLKKSGSRPKQKPAPLSKYRRKTANARERGRMREINQAFETLRRVVPQMSTSPDTNEKLTKITTLRLAMKYISALRSALNVGDNCIQQDLLSDCSELDSFFLDSDGETPPLSSDLSDHSLTPADFSVDFQDGSLSSVDFSTPLSPDFPSDLIEFDPFLSGLS